MKQTIVEILKIVLFVIAIVVFGILINSLKPVIPFSKNVSRLILEGGVAILISLLFYLFMVVWDKRSLSHLNIIPTGAKLKLFCYGAILGIVMLLGVFGVSYLFQAISVVSINNQPNAIVLMIVSMFLAAVWEEIAFRGFLLQKISEICGVHASCFLIATVFGLMHLLSPLCSWQIVISTFLSGMLLNYAYFYSGNIYLPIGIHFGWNALNSVLFKGVFKIDYLNTFLAGIKNPEQGFIAIFITGLAATYFLWALIKKQKHISCLSSKVNLG